MPRIGLITESDRNVQIIDTATQKKLAFAWGAQKVKTREELAKMFGVSRRTASRVLLMHKDQVEAGRLSLIKPEPKTTKKKLTKKVTKKGAAVKAKKPVVSTKKDAKPKSSSDLIVVASNNFISITKGKTTYNADKSHHNFKEALAEIKTGSIQKALDLINVTRSVEVYFHGQFRIEGGIVYYKDIVLNNSLTKRVIDAIKEKQPFTHLLNFFEKCTKNPSRKAVERLFDFLNHNDIEITKDGDFLAWKRVDDNYRDLYSGKFDNSVGKVVKMKREDVDDNDEVTCSRGLHVASESYIPHYGRGRGRIIKTKVNPRHVVSIPIDYEHAKLRCCRYRVVKDVTEEFKNY